MRWLAALTTLGLCGLLIGHLANQLGHDGFGTFGFSYTLLVCSYVFSRFLMAAICSPPKDAGFEPTIAIVVPAFEEGEAVARTIDSCCGVDYPEDKLEVVVINDGSTDHTWEAMNRAAADYPGRVQCIDLGRNMGKRAAMAAGIRATRAEYLVFVDSDSMPAPWAIRKLVQGFVDRRVGAISGRTYLRNAQTNTLTLMQAARYYISFQLLKAAESVLGAVSCCSGRFAAYRRSAVMPILERWEHQHFLGVECTYGDDRALTNMIIRRKWKTLYDCEAEAWTDAPDTYGKFFRQQLRWKKSWVREGSILAAHAWRSCPAAWPAIAIGTLSGFLGPWVLLYSIFFLPFLHGVAPFFYIFCLYLMSTTYALTYRRLRSDGIWKMTILATFFSSSFSIQLVSAIIRIRAGKWGTRTADPQPQEAAAEVELAAA